MPIADPLLVELISRTSWQSLWLPFITAIVGSAVALFGVFWSNRTNRKAIDAADARAKADRQIAHDRDFRLWQRDTLLRLADEVVGAAIEAHNEYTKMMALAHTLDEDGFNTLGTNIDVAGRKIAANIARLGLIGAHQTAERAKVLRATINDSELIGAIFDVASAPKMVVSAQLHDKEDELNAYTAERLAQRDELLERINIARAHFGQTVERELALANLQIFSQPGDS